MGINKNRNVTSTPDTFGEGSIGWMDLVRGYKTTPTLLSTIATGDVYSYVFDGSGGDVTYYRLVPSGSEPDAFYDTFNTGTLSGLIASKGVTI